MTNEEKLSFIKASVGISADEVGEIALLDMYLDMASTEIISWANLPLEVIDEETGEPVPTEMPSKYDVLQVFAVIAGYSQRGAEGQISHSENGITRMWKYDDMIAYIHEKVIAGADVL